MASGLTRSGSIIAGWDGSDRGQDALALTGVRFDARTLPGQSPARALHELAEAECASVVVIGSTHHGPIGRVLLGTVADRLLHGAPVPGGYRTERVRERDWLVGRLREVESDLPADLEVELDLHDGDPAEELPKAAADTDLLVLGSRDYGPVRRVVIGGASAEVIQKSPCPVLVVPRATPVTQR